MNDRTSPYRCKINAPYNRGLLQVSRKKWDVEVVEQSRESFTVHVPPSVFTKLHSQTPSRLYFQATQWSVVCKNKWVDAEGQNLVELECIEELARGRSLAETSGAGGNFAGTARLQKANAMDGTYAAVFLTVMTICILILPAWGGKWGTSQIICDFAVQIWQVLASMIPGGHNLR